jgi:hypothetical protein
LHAVVGETTIAGGDWETFDQRLRGQAAVKAGGEYGTLRATVSAFRQTTPQKIASRQTRKA